MRRRWVSESPAATLALGRRIGALAPGGLVVALEGELGAGKTLLTRGLFEGLGLPDAAWTGSPTFVLASRYPGAPGLLHADFYRLSDGAEVADLGLEDALRDGAVVVVEWADRYAAALPAERLAIRFAVLGEERRELELAATGAAAETLLRELFADPGPADPLPEVRGETWR